VRKFARNVNAPTTLKLFPRHLQDEYTGWSKTVSHFQIIVISCWKPVKSKLDFFIKFQCKSNTRILSVGLKYSMSDLCRDAIN